MKISESGFHCSQDNLYSVCTRSWNSYQNNADQFGAFNGKYTDSYGQAAVQMLREAMGLPNHDQRRSDMQLLKHVCLSSSAQTLRLWKKITRYIANVYPPDQAEAARLSIGSAYYASAASGVLADAYTLFSMALAFISANEDKLESDGQGMPADFITTFANMKGTFDDAYSGYTSLLISSKDDTSEKARANAALYDLTISMMNDGKVIFEGDTNLVNQFTFASVLRSVGKPKDTGLRFLIQEKITELPASTATLVFQPGNVTAYTDKKGIAKAKLGEGKFSCTITMPGYATVIIPEIKTKQGVMRRVDVTIEKAAAVAQAM